MGRFIMGRITGLYIPMFVFTPWAPFTTLTLRPEPAVLARTAQN